MSDRLQQALKLFAWFLIVLNFFLQKLGKPEIQIPALISILPSYLTKLGLALDPTWPADETSPIYKE